MNWDADIPERDWSHAFLDGECGFYWKTEVITDFGAVGQEHHGCQQRGIHRVHECRCGERTANLYSDRRPIR